MSNNEKTDWFARTVAICGLLVAIAAIIIPYYQNKANSQEALSISATPETRGILKLSDNLEKSRAIQIPWIITLSNTGKVKLSITSYSLEQIEGQGITLYPGLNGGLTDANKYALSISTNS